jgi:hypothetical protein
MLCILVYNQYFALYRNLTVKKQIMTAFWVFTPCNVLFIPTFRMNCLNFQCYSNPRKGKAASIFTMKAYRNSTVMAPLIVNLGAGAERTNSRPGRFTPLWGNNPGGH